LSPFGFWAPFFFSLVLFLLSHPFSPEKKSFRGIWASSFGCFSSSLFPGPPPPSFLLGDASDSFPPTLTAYFFFSPFRILHGFMVLQVKKGGAFPLRGFDLFLFLFEALLTPFFPPHRRRTRVGTFFGPFCPSFFAPSFPPPFLRGDLRLFEFATLALPLPLISFAGRLYLFPEGLVLGNFVGGFLPPPPQVPALCWVAGAPFLSRGHASGPPCPP